MHLAKQTHKPVISARWQGDYFLGGFLSSLIPLARMSTANAKRQEIPRDRVRRADFASESIVHRIQIRLVAVRGELHEVVERMLVCPNIRSPNEISVCKIINKF
jgi:hypothetical protein